MPKRPLFWLGLLLGGCGVLALRCRKPCPPTLPADLLLGLSGDGIIVCDASGAMVSANPAAHALFGPECAGLAALRYPTGQPVPPGQLPIASAQTEAEYRCADPDGAARSVSVSSRLLPGGGMAAVFRDITALRGTEARERARQAEAAALHHLGVRLGKTDTAEAVAAAVVEEAHALLSGLPDAQVRLYSYSRAAQTITWLASAPEERAKPSQNQPAPRTFPFNADDPALWQLYVARRPVPAEGALTLPLLSGGLAIGHLALFSTDPDAFVIPERRLALETLASLAALALATPSAAELADSMARQGEALGEIGRALADGLVPDRLADVAVRCVRRLTDAAACTVSVPVGDTLAALGTAYADDLLSPESTLPDAKGLHGKAVQKAWRTQKAMSLTGLANPNFKAGVWRGFAGNGGRHSVFALPLSHKRGVLTVYRGGGAPMPEAQLKFLETVAALLSAGLLSAALSPAPASVPEDSAGA